MVQTGCSSSDDTLACLRTVSYETLKAAIDNSPFIFDYQVGDLSKVSMIQNKPSSVINFGVATSGGWRALLR